MGGLLHTCHVMYGIAQGPRGISTPPRIFIGNWWGGVLTKRRQNFKYHTPFTFCLTAVFCQIAIFSVYFRHILANGNYEAHNYTVKITSSSAIAERPR